MLTDLTRRAASRLVADLRARTRRPQAPAPAVPFERRVVRHRYHGRDLWMQLADPVGESWYDLDYPEVPEIAFLAEHRLRPGAVVFDIGAHQGLYAALLAAEVAPDGRVVAVEANEFNADVAVTNMHLNGIENV